MRNDDEDGEKDGVKDGEKNSGKKGRKNSDKRCLHMLVPFMA